MHEIPGTLWDRPEMRGALQVRDFGRVFELLRQYAGLSQTAIGSLTGLAQGKVSDIMNGRHQVTAFDVVERIADGVSMPDAARITLGLAPHTALALLIPRQDDGPGFAAPTAPPSVDRIGDSEGDEMRRRQFVGLTGAALFSAVVGKTDATHDIPCGIEDLAAALTEPPMAVDRAPEIAPLAQIVAEAKASYQACHYTQVIALLPPLLRSLRVAGQVLDGDLRTRAHEL